MTSCNVHPSELRPSSRPDFDVQTTPTALQAPSATSSPLSSPEFLDALFPFIAQVLFSMQPVRLPEHFMVSAQ